MSTDAEFKPPRKKPNVLWWIAGVLVVLSVLFFVQLCGPNPAIVVSKQTTFIMQPLASAGLPDYERSVLESARGDATPDNNAAVLLWQALGPHDINAAEFATVAAEIGLEPVPSKSETLLPLYRKEMDAKLAEWLKNQPYNAAGNVSADDAANRIREQAGDHSWTSAQIPPLTDWLKQNQVPLDLLVAGANRPSYYSPSPTLLSKDPDLLVSMMLPDVQAVREVARDLSTRAMWHLGEGRPMQAWNDVRAIHRWARHLATKNTLIDQLVAMAVDGIACQCTQTIVHQGKLTPDECRQILLDYDQLPRFSGVADAIDQGERLCAVDSIVKLASGADPRMFADANIEEFDAAEGILHFVSFDWNLVLIETNKSYDRLVAIAQLPDNKARRDALAANDAAMLRLFATERTPTKFAVGLFSRRQRSQLVANTFLNLYLPSISNSFAAQDRANTNYELTRLAIALSQFRATHEHYPDTLDELKQVEINSLPVDTYNDKPFIYKRDSKGYLLYSAGENGIDETGSNESQEIFQGRGVDWPAYDPNVPIPAGSDDITIRLPHPPLELFEQPKSGNKP